MAGAVQPFQIRKRVCCFFILTVIRSGTGTGQPAPDDTKLEDSTFRLFGGGGNGTTRGICIIPFIPDPKKYFLF